MKNYKNLILNALNSIINQNWEETYEEVPVELMKIAKEAYAWTYKFMVIRFENQLKHYNGDEEKAYDFYMAKTALDYYRIYAEEMMLINNCPNCSDHNPRLRKEMRYILNWLHNLINEENNK